MRYRFLSVFDTVFRYLPNVTLKNMWRENILDHEYLWRESTQIGRSSQKMAQQV